MYKIPAVMAVDVVRQQLGVDNSHRALVSVRNKKEWNVSIPTFSRRWFIVPRKQELDPTVHGIDFVSADDRV